MASSDAERVRGLLGRVRLIPDELRNFRVPLTAAWHVYGLDDDLMETLLRLGLPSCRVNGDVLLDALDLQNIGFGLALPTPQRTVVLRWGRSLAAPFQDARGSYEIRLDWKCPDPGHPGECRFRPGPPISTLPLGSDGYLVGAKAIVRAEPLSDRHDFGSTLDPLVSEVKSLVFHHLPEALTSDLDFVRRTGLADCRLANRRLMGLAEDLGISVRPAAGFFVGVPFPTRHAWLEIDVGGRWVAVDPFFLHTLATWGVVDADEWPLTASPRNVLWRLGSSIESPLVLHADVVAPVTVGARWVGSPTAPCTLPPPHG